METSLRQPLGALAQREVSHQPFKGGDVLASAFERRPDRLCAARQLAELLRLPLKEVLSDFDAICDRGWQERGITPEEIRRFCVWRGAPMLYVNCQGQLLDAYQPAEKEARAVAFTAWQGHAFFYKNARTVYQCDDAERLRPRFRSERRESGVPEFARWQEWDGQPRAGHFWTRDLRGARAALMAAGHCPRVAMRSLCEWRSLRLRAGEADCVICDLPEDAEVLQAWMESFGLRYRGQRLAGATNEVFLHLLRAQREVPQQREQILASQGGVCKLCGAPVALGTCEFDHVVPVSTAFRGQIQEFQALCHECHRLKTGLENSQATALESRFSPTACEAYVSSPRLPPLVCGLQKWNEDRVCWGVDVVRCRKNGLANARFPLPVFCPLDSVARAGTPSRRARSCSRRASRRGRTSCGASTPPPTWTRAAWPGRWGRWRRPGRRSTWPS